MPNIHWISRKRLPLSYPITYLLLLITITFRSHFRQASETRELVLERTGGYDQMDQGKHTVIAKRHGRSAFTILPRHASLWSEHQFQNMIMASINLRTGIHCCKVCVEFIVMIYFADCYPSFTPQTAIRPDEQDSSRVFLCSTTVYGRPAAWTGPNRHRLCLQNPQGNISNELELRLIIIYLSE